MDAMEAITTRRSVRQFSQKPVPDELIYKLIDAGRLAPTANNVQPWEFVVVTNKQIREKIASLANYGSFIAGAPVCIAVFCKDTKYYLEDGCAATENILIAAHALGLGSSWVAGDKKPYCNEIKEILNVPPAYKLISLLPIGYPLDTPTAHDKRGINEVMHKEKF